MKEHPILFSAPMVRALLAGTKTQTRRLVTWQGPKDHPHFFDRAFTDNPAGIRRLCVPHHHPDDKDAGAGNPCHRHYPRWEKGDRLWVKETHAKFTVGEGLDVSVPQCVAYRATCDESGGFDYANGRGEIMRLTVTKWTPSIFMPRWASRITLDVTEEPTPQRLQDISEDDARAEGVTPDADCLTNRCARPHRDRYFDLWNEINGPGSWEANPWIWRIAFRVLP
jgi:hypothetical protein